MSLYRFLLSFTICFTMYAMKFLVCFLLFLSIIVAVSVFYSLVFVANIICCCLQQLQQTFSFSIAVIVVFVCYFVKWFIVRKSYNQTQTQKPLGYSAKRNNIETKKNFICFSFSATFFTCQWWLSGAIFCSF